MIVVVVAEPVDRSSHVLQLQAEFKFPRKNSAGLGFVVDYLPIMSIISSFITWDRCSFV